MSKISNIFECSLSDFTFPDKYSKLIKRIENLNGFNNLHGEKFNIETISSILELDPHYFSSFPSVGKLYVELLIELKKELSSILEGNNEINFQFEEKIFTSSDYSLETSINELPLTSQYQKLMKKILAVMDNVKIAQDIVNIDVNKFSKLPYVGKLYVELLIKLQNKLNNENLEVENDAVIEIQELEPVVELTEEQLNTPLAQIKFSPEHQKIIKRTSNLLENVYTVKDIIRVNIGDFSKVPSVGKSYIKNLIDLKRKLPNIVVDMYAKSIRFRDNYSIDFTEIDAVLIEDVESYLWTLDDKKMDVALSRWGFNQQHETLEEVGKRHNLTRERIRQFEKTINTNLILSLRIEPKVLWANIREKMTENLTVLLPNLAKCFNTGKLFYEFIGLCCQVESSSIYEIVTAKVNPKIINQLFCTNQSPLDQEIVINELTSNYGYSKASAINSIKHLEKSEHILITEQGIYPKNLSKIEAIAHVLTFHSSGLPWKDIARIANKKGYSSNNFDETRQATSAWSCSEYVYLSGLGTYRNLMFLDVEQFDIPNLMQWLLDYFNQNNLTALHLHDYYQSTRNQQTNIEYFTLRHLVREYGEEYGIYFNGKSGSDSVSIDKDSKRIIQSDVIIKVLNESKVAMTMQEIAERLRSKSTGHASFYIHNLMEEGKVVRVDKMVYTTTEKAFSNINTKAIMQVIKDIMNVPNAIVEADIFREYINMELNLSYSKYIYASLVKTQLKEIKWYCNNTLFSKRTIPYKNLADVCRQLCNPTLSNNENIKIIQKAIWLTDSVAMSIIQSWRLV